MASSRGRLHHARTSGPPQFGRGEAIRARNRSERPIIRVSASTEAFVFDRFDCRIPSTGKAQSHDPISRSSRLAQPWVRDPRLGALGHFRLRPRPILHVGLGRRDIASRPAAGSKSPAGQATVCRRLCGGRLRGKRPGAASVSAPRLAPKAFGRRIPLDRRAERPRRNAVASRHASRRILLCRGGPCKSGSSARAGL